MPTSTRSTSLWMKEDKRPSYTPLSTNATADVCVIGAGIAGLTTAYHLSKEGKKVIILDDGEIAGGETERTTAHLTYVLGTFYQEFEKIHGKKRSGLIADAHASAIDRIEEIAKTEKIDCDFLRVDGFLFLADPDNQSDKDELSKELESLHRIGRKDVSMVTHDVLHSPALKYPNQGQFHILKYIRGLADAVTRHGGIIHTKTHVKKYESQDQECRIETDEGHTVTAKAVVVATNAPIQDNIQIYGKQAAYRTFVIAAKIPKGSMKPELYWDTEDPYHFIRTQEGDDHDFLIVGGEDHKTGQQNDAELRFANLERFLRARFPKAGEIAYRWSGQVMDSYDGIAMIGHMPMSAKNIYVSTGDSGNGITHGTIAGMLLTDMILEHENPWEDVFNPSRIRLRAGKEFLTENANTASEAVCGWVATGGPKDHDLKPGVGGVFAEGTKKIALYVDDDGTRHEFSAVCPHRGCIVQWNSFEKSFDCPCHGSRFACDGKALNGPVVSGLAPLVSSKEKIQ